MQTLEFTRALKEVVSELKIAELVAILNTWLMSNTSGSNPPLSEPDKDRFSDLIFSSRSGYDRLSAVEATAKILKGLDAQDFYEPSRLRRLISSLTGINNIAQLRASAEMYAFFEKFRSLQKLTETCTNLLENERIGTIAPTAGIVELELTDYDGMGIEPERLKVFAVTVRNLHSNLALLFKIEGDQLRFKYFDSGSNMRAGVECAKEIAATIGTLLLQYWDKIMFHKYETFERRIDAASKGLAFIETVREKIDKKVITEEVGKNLTHRVLKEVDNLIGIGATVPLTEVAVDQRELLLERRNVKLLESGQPNDIGEVGTHQTP